MQYASRILFRNRTVHLIFSSRTTKLQTSISSCRLKREESERERERERKDKERGSILFHETLKRMEVKREDRKENRNRERKRKMKSRKREIKNTYSHVESLSVLYIGIHTRKVIIYMYTLYIHGMCACVCVCER